MTHEQIYTKFMIEYDKANVTSSYPSLTEYEVATVLDKAYNALIAQKVTGNNYRRSTLEADTKAVSDLQNLIVTTDIFLNSDTKPNTYKCELPDRFLYFVSGEVKTYLQRIAANQTDLQDETTQNYNEFDYGIDSIELIPHRNINSYTQSSSNMPWLKHPVCYIQNNSVYVVTDLSKKLVEEDDPSLDDVQKPKLYFTYISKPNSFVKDIENVKADDQNVQTASYFTYETLSGETANSSTIDKYTFELNDTMAEELISLAITFALENVESPRLNSKLNTRVLES